MLKKLFQLKTKNLFAENENEPSASFPKRKKMTALIMILVFAAVSYGVYQKYFNLTDAERAQKDLNKAVSSISRHILLPQGDQPVLATVTDAGALIKQQAFFAGAKNGDQLLLFPRSLKAIIYSPSRDMIVNVGPIQQPSATVAGNDQITNPRYQTNSNSPAGGQNPNTQNEVVLSVEVRNGTGKTGYASTVADQINGQTGYSVIKVGDAAKKDYAKTIIFSSTTDASKNKLASSLAAELNGEVATQMPQGEETTAADVMVILGR